MDSKSKWKRIACSVIALVALPLANANAQEDRPTPPKDFRVKSATHVQMGARLGYGIGAGQVYDGFNVSEGSYGMVPFIADVGVRVVEDPAPA